MPPRKSTAIFVASILSVLALPPWMAFMYRAWPRTKGIPPLLAEVGQPVPGEQALAGDGEPVAEGGDGGVEGLGPGGDGAGQGGLAVGVQDVQGQRPGVQVDAAVESVLLVVEPHHGLRVGGTCRWLLQVCQIGRAHV